MGKIFISHSFSSRRYSNEDLLDVISKMLSDEYFSFLLETKYSDKKNRISKYTQKIPSKPLESSGTRDLLLMIYKVLKNLWLSEGERVDLGLVRKFEKHRNDTAAREKLGQLLAEMRKSLNSRYSDILGSGSIPSLFEEAEPIAQYLVVEKSLEEVPKSYPTLELYKPKKHFRLELLRGRAPGTLSLVS